MSVVTLLPEGEHQRLDRYQLIGEIASGGMASVFLARLGGVAGFQRFVAIKRLHPHLAKEREFVEMFLDEARLAASIHHRNVVPILEIGTTSGGYYLVMEFIEGVTLARLMTQAAVLRQPIPQPVLLRIVVDTLSGLHAAHELCDDGGQPMGVVHRDCSPQNILVGHDGCTRITDFGIARARARLHNTREGAMKGKLAYMAPEQSQGEDFDRRADLFSVATVLWEVLAERRLFKGKTEAQTLRRLLHDPIPRLSEVMSEIHPAIDAMVHKALSRAPAERFATAAEMADALENAARAVGAGDAIATERLVESLMQDRYGGDFSEQREALRNWLQATPTMVGARGPATDRGWLGPTRSEAGGHSPSGDWLVKSGVTALIDTSDDEPNDSSPTRPARRSEVVDDIEKPTLQQSKRKRDAPPPTPRRGSGAPPPRPLFSPPVGPGKKRELPARKPLPTHPLPLEMLAPEPDAPDGPAAAAPPERDSDWPAAGSAPTWSEEGAGDDETNIYDPPSTTGMTGSRTVGAMKRASTVRSQPPPWDPELPMTRPSSMTRWVLAAALVMGATAIGVMALRSGGLGSWWSGSSAPASGQASRADTTAAAPPPAPSEPEAETEDDAASSSPDEEAIATPADSATPAQKPGRNVSGRNVARPRKPEPPEPKAEPKPEPKPEPKADDTDDLSNPYR